MLSGLLVVAMVAGASSCLPGDPPAGYYGSVTGTDGATIRSQLTALTNQAITRSYGDARDLLQVIDEDPSNPSNIVLTYTGGSIDSTWTSGSTWNREHTWPRSLGVGDSGSDNSDLHMLRPCNPSVNSSRGNKQFGTNGNQWDPDRYGQAFRGEMARVVFYASTRYTYLSIPVIGSQTQFVDWHFEQMPDDDDRRRNDRVFTYQQNRNPYVDRPEWVWAVFGDAPSDAQITVSGAAAVDGASSQTVDLGMFIDDGTPMAADVQLTKAGAAPVTYLLSVDGDIASDAATGYQAGFGRGAGSAAVPVTIGGGPGLLEGTLTVENTDVTSAGAGLGSADGDDVVTVTALSLTPSVASLDPLVFDAERTIDVGEVPVGSTSGPIAVEVWNLAPSATGAMLDIDSVTVTGLADGVSLVGAPLLDVPGGSSGTLTLEVAPLMAGTIDATVTIAVSDEDLPGESFGELTLTVLATSTDRCPADVNGDGVLDDSDFFMWVTAYTLTPRTPELDAACDVNLDGACDDSDFFMWVTFFTGAGCP